MIAGVVVAGGRSSRMGSSKAALGWHGSTLLCRTVLLLGRAVDGPVVVVRAPGQELPTLPAGIEVLDDPVEGRGPLQGIGVGLAAVADRAAAAFVAAVDMPFLHPAFVRRVLRDLGPDVDVVLPVARGHQQPLAAAYSTALAPRIAEMIEAGRTRPGMLFAEVRVLRLDDVALLADTALAALDPELDSLLNVNEPVDYRRARDRPPPLVAVDGDGTGAGTRIRAATLGAAVTLLGAAVCGRTVTVPDGGRSAADPDLPLVAGDVVLVGAGVGPA